ncbi:MAG: HEAT repeat domain-containing protein [FCB group bacterium]|nr:HEAT repeat domain-containing protein [FCB group bacterium]
MDSALVEMNMSHGDLWLPWDAVPDDAQRLSIVKETFANPPGIAFLTEQYADSLNADPAAFLGNMREVITDTILSGQALMKILSRPVIPAETPALPFWKAIPTQVWDKLYQVFAAKTPGEKETTSSVLKIVSASMTTSARISQYLASVDSTLLQQIIAQADSMLLMSEDSQEMSVWDLKKSELESEKTATDFFAATENFDLNEILVPSLDLFSLIYSTLDSIRLKKEIRTRTVHTDYGDIRFGGTGDDVHAGDYLLIIDFGGDDTYLLPDLDKSAALRQPVRIIIDTAGDDRYFGGDYAFGGGFFGTSLLFDNSGNDYYAAGNFALGSGLFGAGILVDIAGNDLYSGKTCVEGSGAFGIGLLLDASGSDLYRSYAQAQGFGFTRGFGALADYSGNDVYATTSPFQDFLRYDTHFVAFTQGAGLGYRPIASGGIGMLFDYAGNDTYQTDIFGQGTAYWYSLGALYDRAGDDRYLAYQYAQGAGIHLAHAVLVDLTGNDHYYSHGVSQGCGHDIAFGGLFDLAGDDDYTAESLSMGGGNADAISVLIDEKGDDSYIARNLKNMQGYSDFRRNYGMIGIFADGAGDDLYGSPAGNNTVSRKSTFGVFADYDLFPEIIPNTTEPLLTPPDSLKIPLASTVDSLFIQASAAPQKFQYNVQPAREKIIARGAQALPFLKSRLNTSSARERHALEAILKKMLEGRDSTAYKTLLTDSLTSVRRPVVSMCARVAGSKKVREALPQLTQLTNSPQWQVRALAALQLGRIGDASSLPVLSPLLQDEHVHVRMRAAYAIGILNPPHVEFFLPVIFSDTSQLVRNSFIQGLKRTQNKLSMPAFLKILRSSNQNMQEEILKLISNVVETDSSGKIFREWIRFQSPTLRKQLTAELEGSGSTFWKEILDSLNTEPEPVSEEQTKPMKENDE